MENIYTQQNVNQFFEGFKTLPYSFDIEKVHQLINNPNAKATHKVNFQFNYFKLIIMTSAFIIVGSALIFWLTPKKSDSNVVTTEKQPISVEFATKNEINEGHNRKTVPNDGIKNHPFKSKDLSNDIKKQIISSNDDLKMESLTNPDIITDSTSEESCIWPSDTVLDKQSLIIHLTNNELEKLGVYNRNDSMKYKNVTPDGKHRLSMTFLWADYGGKWPYTKLPFYMIDLTDTINTDYNRNLYERYDTLIPIQTIITDKPFILWFTPHPAIFDSLPERYQYVEKTYNNLRCIKKSNPNHQIVNYWKKEEIFELDNINYLDLPIENLQYLGFQFFKDSLSLVHPDLNMHYIIGKKEAMMGTISNGEKIPYPPNPLPVVVTDEKGHWINYYGMGKYKDFDNSMFDLLVPVRISFSELIEGRNYVRIFWFYPTDEFVDALPLEIKDELKLERDAIISNSIDAQSSCTFFEVCKSTLAIDDLKVYPNPASQNIKIEFSLPQETNGRISLVNISGVLVKYIVPESNFNSGLNTFDVNLSDVSSGVYLISIITPNGFMTQRVIVSR